MMPTDSAFYYALSGLSEFSVVLNFYKQRQHYSVWSENGRRSLLSDKMMEAVNSARLYGLLPQDYHQIDIQAIWQDSSVQALIRLDVLLTDAFFAMSRHLKHGRIHTTVSTATSDSTYIVLLNEGLRTGELNDILRAQEPTFAEYRSLKNALQQTLNTASLEDSALLLSGITFDSITLHRKIQCIEINLERWRWEDQIAERYVWINIPSYELRVIENEKVILKSKVIVGSPVRQTPVLSSVIECFVIYPYWHVPRKIAVQELLPVIQRDTTYLKRNNFDVLDRQGNLLDPSGIAWQMFTKDYFPVMLRQREGSENSLGIVKFVFDNPYAVYLHDTNVKRFFNQRTRALSHGCIRIEKAIELAHYLVTGNVYSTSEDVTKYFSLKKKHVLNLTHPIPVYTRYFTCEYSDNELQTYPDIYKKDPALVRDFYHQVIDL